MNRNHQGDKNPQNRMGMDSQSQSRQASGRGSSDVSQNAGASRGSSQQGLDKSDASGRQQSSRDTTRH